MDSMDLYGAVGGRDGCTRLSKAFYARVDRDPLLRPLFPGKSLRCAEEAFAAFLAQFLGGPAEDAQQRWSLSLRESHARLEIGPRERAAWMRHMVQALEEVPLEEPVREALRAWFERGSAYLVNRGVVRAQEEQGHGQIDGEIARRWDEQRALDELVAAIRVGAAGQALELAGSPTLACRFARDRAVLAHVLGLMMATDARDLLAHVERELRTDPGLARIHHRFGRTLLHDASALGNPGMVELLLGLGADPNGRTSGGHTPLYSVANECWRGGGGEVVRALVRAGAEVDARSDSKQCTALHMAARRGNVEVAAALVECGADIHAGDKGGDTPLDRAKNCRKPTVAALLARASSAARVP